MEENKKIVINFGNQMGEKIRAARKKAGLTQKMLADELGVSLQLISQWETGRRYPRNKTLARIAEALNVSIVDLLGINMNIIHRNIEDMKKSFEDFSLENQKRIISVTETIEELYEIKVFLDSSGENYLDSFLLKEFKEFIDMQINELMELHNSLAGYEFRIADAAKDAMRNLEDAEKIKQRLFILKTAMMKQAVSGEAIIDDFIKLNDEGRAEAAKRVNELTFIPKYNRKAEQEE